MRDLKGSSGRQIATATAAWIEGEEEEGGRVATGKIRGELIFLNLWTAPIMSPLSFHLNSNLSRSSRSP